VLLVGRLGEARLSILVDEASEGLGPFVWWGGEICKKPGPEKSRSEVETRSASRGTRRH